MFVSCVRKILRAWSTVVLRGCSGCSGTPSVASFVSSSSHLCLWLHCCKKTLLPTSGFRHCFKSTAPDECFAHLGGVRGGSGASWGALWGLRGRLGPFRGGLGSLLAHLGALLGRSWPRVSKRLGAALKPRNSEKNLGIEIVFRA